MAFCDAFQQGTKEEVCLDRDQIGTRGSAADHFGSPTVLAHGGGGSTLPPKPKRSNLTSRNQFILEMSA